jgi:L-iditol 2-dehydrogenase
MIALVKYSHGVGKIELRDVPEPTGGDADVKIAVKAAGICGTDIHHYDDEYPCDPPVILGHECAGQVVEVGADVTEVKVGDRVTAMPFAVTCGHCRYCREGELGLCPERVAFGSFLDGAFAPFLVVPASAVHRLPDNVDFDIGALAEPLTNGVKATYEVTTIQAGEVVLVTGPGPIGMLTGLLAKAQDTTVIMVGTSADSRRLELARTLGMDYTLQVGTDDVALVVKELTEGAGADVLFECSGAAAAVRSALTLVRKQGQITQVGIVGRPFELDYDQIILRDIRVVGSFGNSLRSWDRALTLLREEAIQVAPLISAVLPLSQWERGFRISRQKEGMKVLLRPGD